MDPNVIHPYYNKFVQFVNNVMALIPDRTTNEVFMRNVKNIVDSSHYASPETIVNYKKQFCDLLTYNLPIYNPPAEWQMKIIGLIRSTRFD